MKRATGRCGNANKHRRRCSPTKDAEWGKCKWSKAWSTQCPLSWRIGFWDWQCWAWVDWNSKWNAGKFKLDTRAGITAIPHHYCSTDKPGKWQVWRLYNLGRQYLNVKVKKRVQFTNRNWSSRQFHTVLAEDGIKNSNIITLKGLGKPRGSNKPGMTMVTCGVLLPLQDSQGRE